MLSAENKALAKKHQAVIERFQQSVENTDIDWDDIMFTDLAFGFLLGAGVPSAEAWTLAYIVNIERIKFK